MNKFASAGFSSIHIPRLSAFSIVTRSERICHSSHRVLALQFTTLGTCAQCAASHFQITSLRLLWKETQKQGKAGDYQVSLLPTIRRRREHDNSWKTFFFFIEYTERLKRLGKWVNLTKVPFKIGGDELYSSYETLFFLHWVAREARVRHLTRWSYLMWIF